MQDQHLESQLLHQGKETILETTKLLKNNIFIYIRKSRK